MNRKKILIIDDDPSFLEICSAILEESDYQVDTAASSKEGLEKLVSLRPDLLLLDIMMATMDEGLNFATSMRQREDLNKIPIMIVSAQPDAEKGYQRSVDTEMDWISADMFLEKPINPQDLLHNVRLLIG
jgi:CheY-like chemotaxis protein